MKKRAGTRERLLATTADLLQRQGYASTGLNQILDESGAPKGSLYFHFPGGKEELAALALTASAESLTVILESILTGAPSIAAAIDGIVATFAHELEGSKFTKGCPIATVALEQAAISDALHEVCSSTYARWQVLVADRLERDGHSDERAAELAGFALATIEGALLLGRAHRSTEPLRRAGVELRRVLQGSIA
jgi:TetR/AcrR family transcriptional repressor of lmrAB and yxaGH operons